MPLFIIFIVVPLIELFLLLEVGSIIGSGWVFLLIIATAIIGTRLVKQQGLATWQNIQQQLAQGQLPAQSLFDGICILVSGVLLITPGFMTDILGFLLLAPVFRSMTYSQLGSRIKVQSHGAFSQPGANPFKQDSESKFERDIKDRPTTTLDGEYTRKE